MKRRWLDKVSYDLVRVAFRDYFGTQENHVDVLVILYEQHGRPLRVNELGRALNPSQPLSNNAVMVRVNGLREAMDCEAVDTTPCGYVLTEVGLRECGEALAQMASALVAYSNDAAPRARAALAKDVASLPLMRLVKG